MNNIKLTKMAEQIKVPTRSAGGYKIEVVSQSRYLAGDGYEIVSFFTPYYRNGYSAWNGNVERIEWSLIKDGKVVYTASSRQGYKKGTRKECMSALKYIMDHGELPPSHSSDMARIENGRY